MAPAERTLKTCRLCWRTLDWSPQYLEAGELQVFYRCHHCGVAFPIRHADAAKLRRQGLASAGGVPAGD